MADYSLSAMERTQKGTQASRRLRREGWIPANIYGGGEEPRMAALSENEVVQLLDDESFFASLISIQGLDETQDVLVRELQMHPYKPKPVHVDFERIPADQKVTLQVPVHTTGEEHAPGVVQGGNLSLLLNEVQVSCLPANIPDAVEVDVGEMQIGDVLHMSDLKTPAGVELVYDPASDEAVVSVVSTRASQQAAATES